MAHTTYTALRHTTLYHAVLRPECAVIHHSVPCFAVLRCTAPDCAVLHCIVQCCAILRRTAPDCAGLRRTAPD
eukprot:6154182-Alexandrium_andersonii.AAC.1